MSEPIFKQWDYGAMGVVRKPREPVVLFRHEGGEWESDDGKRIICWRRSWGQPVVIDWDSAWPWWRRLYVRLRGIR